MQKHIFPFGFRIYLSALGLKTYILTRNSKSPCKENLFSKREWVSGGEEELALVSPINGRHIFIFKFVKFYGPVGVVVTSINLFFVDPFYRWAN